MTQITWDVLVSTKKLFMKKLPRVSVFCLLVKYSSDCINTGHKSNTRNRECDNKFLLMDNGRTGQSDGLVLVFYYFMVNE